MWQILEDQGWDAAYAAITENSLDPTPFAEKVLSDARATGDLDTVAKFENLLSVPGQPYTSRQGRYLNLAALAPYHFFNGQRVVLINTKQGDQVPVGTHGAIVRADNEDADLYTYEVQWDNGILDSGVRAYNLQDEGSVVQAASMPEVDEDFISTEELVLEQVLGRGIIAPDELPSLLLSKDLGGKALRDIVERGQIAGKTNEQMADEYITMLEGAQVNTEIPTVVNSIRRLAAYTLQAADTQSAQHWITKFYGEMVPKLEAYTYLNPETQEQLIIPDSTDQWNQFYAELDAYHSHLLAHKEQPDVIAVIREIEDYNKDIHTETTSKEGLVKLKDTPAPEEAPVAPLRSPDEPIEHELGDKVEDVMAKLPTTAPAIDELLERWNLASPEQRPAIEERIKKLHQMSLESFLRARRK